MEQFKKPYTKLKKKKMQFLITFFIMTVLLVGIAVFATLIAYKTPWIYDMTKDKLFTLSPQTFEVLETVSSENSIEIAAVYPDNAQDKMVVALLREYEKSSENISLALIDAEREPAKLSQYDLNVSAVTKGTIIVRYGEKSKILSDSSFYTKTESGNAFSGERMITSAIRFVTSKNTSVVYVTEGHNEASLTELAKAKQYLELQNFEVRSLNLLKTDAVPEDAGLVLIPSPKKDLAESEKKALETYLSKGGNTLFLIDALSTNTMVLENFNQILNGFGIDIHNNFVLEEDSNFYMGNNRMVLMPGYVFHSITEALAEEKNYVILPVSMGLRTVPVDKALVKTTPLLLSSEKSFMRTDVTNQSSERIETDIDGPITLASASIKSNAKIGEKDSRMVVIGNSNFINNESIDTQANSDFFMSCINYFQSSPEMNVISPKIINADTFLVRGSDFTKLSVICIGVLPMIAFIGAYMVWRIRRNQ